ncbi:MAG: hypothetical protein IPP60_10330 [Sphingobacteriales bacterium]|nr:hypothetical protein [Sphingobacteriales bacterium]HNY53983.1 DUF5606 domain-containing protein [Chitinophagales bacterium]
MEFREIIAVTGIAGLKRVVANRNDGLILSELDGSNKKFYSNRQHMFSPLENIAIYTDNDTVPLLDVLIEMKNQKATNAPVDANATNDVLRNYLGTILPNFDRERVNISDIKKLIKWFAILEDLDVIKKSETPTTEEAKVAAKKDVAPAKTKAPAKDVVVQKQSVAKPRMTKNKV